MWIGAQEHLFQSLFRYRKVIMNESVLKLCATSTCDFPVKIIFKSFKPLNLCLHSIFIFSLKMLRSINVFQRIVWPWSVYACLFRWALSLKVSHSRLGFQKYPQKYCLLQNFFVKFHFAIKRPISTLFMGIVSIAREWKKYRYLYTSSTFTLYYYSVWLLLRVWLEKRKS